MEPSTYTDLEALTVGLVVGAIVAFLAMILTVIVIQLMKAHREAKG